MHREISIISSILYSCPIIFFYINEFNMTLCFLFSITFVYFLNKIIKYFDFSKVNIISLFVVMILHLYLYYKLVNYQQLYHLDFNIILYVILGFYYFRYFVGKLFHDYKFKKEFCNGTKPLKNYDYKEYLYIKNKILKEEVDIPIYVSDTTDSWAELTVNPQDKEVFVFNASFFGLSDTMKEAIILHEIGHYKNKHIKRSLKLDYTIRLLVIPLILTTIFFTLKMLSIQYSLLIFIAISQFFFAIDIFILNRMTFLKELEAERYLFHHLKLSPMDFLLYLNISKKSIDIENNKRNRILYSFIKGYPTKEHISEALENYYTKDEISRINSNLSMIRNFNKIKKKVVINPK